MFVQLRRHKPNSLGSKYIKIVNFLTISSRTIFQISTLPGASLTIFGINEVKFIKKWMKISI